MRIHFWGTRGSIPKPGPDTVRYGGNTSCVEVRTESGVLILLDCGTGAHGLGQALIAEKEGPRRGHVFISHTHWDHIQGLPFLAPLFDPRFEWDIYGPRGLGPTLRESLAGQMQYTYFPITLEQFAAKVRYHDLVEGTVQIDDVRVRTHYMNHPALTLGYRIEADHATLVYATDHEPHSPALAHGERPPQGADECRYAEFVANADLLIHDAQFTEEEYDRYRGWGHSPVEFAIDIAAAGRVRQLALYHHDPMRNDAAVDRIVERAQQRAAGTGVEVFAAAEGMQIVLAPRGIAGDTAEPANAATAEVGPGPGELVALLATSAPAGQVLAAAIEADGGRLLQADGAEQLLLLAVRERPSVIFIQRELAGGDELRMCRTLRALDRSEATAPAIVIVSSRQGDIDVDAGAAAGATDWLLWPFKESYARTRLHRWALRQACRWLAAPVPEGEEQRLRALHDLKVLDTPPEERFDRVTRIAAQLFGVSTAVVSLVARDRQWFKSKVGFDADETPRELSFCAHAILEPGVMQVPDALQDPRFADNPLVTGSSRVRFYAGAPIAAPDGSMVGSLCIIDHRARQLDADQLVLLQDLAKLVETELSAPLRQGA